MGRLQYTPPVDTITVSIPSTRLKVTSRPASAEAAEARMSEGYECTDWYFCKRDL